MRIKSLTARQIINSKGHPTLQVEVSTAKNTATSSVPLAGSKSRFEFEDNYDNNLKRFHYETLNGIIEAIDRVIAPEFVGRNSMDQDGIDKLLLELDNTLDRSHLGITTITAISQAVAKLGALESDLPLFKYIRVLHDFTGVPNIRLNSEYRLPTPVITIYRSALHDLHHTLPVQEVMIMPKGSFSYEKDLVKLFHAITELSVNDNKQTLQTFLADLTKQLSKLKVKFCLGIDMAGSNFKVSETGTYQMKNFHSNVVNFHASFKKLLKAYLELIQKYKIQFLEDPFSEDDYSAWKDLNDALFEKDPSIQLVSDDFTATNLERLEKISMLETANNIVIKPSQIGTISEVIHFTQLARKFDKRLTVSYRLGETEDTFIADLAVGINADYFRSGYALGSEYISKLNRLLQIEESLR